MARGRHRRRSGLLARLVPGRRRARVAALEAEVARLRVLAEVSAATAAAALVRAAAAGDSALLAQQRSLRTEAERCRDRDEVARLRADLAALREELVWAFAAGKADVQPQVVDLRVERATSA